MTQTAQDYCRQGRNEELTRAGNERAKACYQPAIELDPDYMPSYAEFSYVYVREFQNAWSEDRADSLNKALAHAEKAVALTDDPNSKWHGDFRGRWYRAIVYWNQGAFARSFEEFRMARSLIAISRRLTDEPDLDADMAEALIYGGEPELAIEIIEDAMRRKPGFPYWYWWNQGRAFYMCSQYRSAIAAIEHIADPPNDVRLITAASHAQLGNGVQAEALTAAFSAEDPDWTVAKSAAYPYERHSDREHWIDGLRKARLRES